MKFVKIYNKKYLLEDTSPDAPDAYAFRGVLYDGDYTPPGKVIGYVTMEDGSVIECYKKFNILKVILPLLFLLIVVGCITAYLVFFQPKDVIGPGGLKVKSGTDSNVVSYNGFMAIEDGQLSICFQNGNEPATVRVIGDGISADELSVEPGEYVASIPATFTTEDGLVQAKIVIDTETSTSENEVVVEIPENNTEDSPDSGLEGYWKGEHVYGTDPEPAE